MEKWLKMAVALTLQEEELGLTEVKWPLILGQTCFLTGSPTLVDLPKELLPE